MPSYLVETFLARGAAGEREAFERRARARLPIHIPGDEVCFFTFGAPSGRDAALVAQRAGLQAIRIVEAIPSEREES